MISKLTREGDDDESVKKKALTFSTINSINYKHGQLRLKYGAPPPSCVSSQSIGSSLDTLLFISSCCLSDILLTF